mmetsp:Transcript_3032/g.8414  ORF Transcript_3032/g.8414 Transcript_3032/m.8414 type:complete len:295 (-) Transcript_3032:78-962(-)
MEGPCHVHQLGKATLVSHQCVSRPPSDDLADRFAPVALPCIVLQQAFCVNVTALPHGLDHGSSQIRVAQTLAQIRFCQWQWPCGDRCRPNALPLQALRRLPPGAVRPRVTAHLDVERWDLPARGIRSADHGHNALQVLHAIRVGHRRHKRTTAGGASRKDRNGGRQTLCFAHVFNCLLHLRGLSFGPTAPNTTPTGDSHKDITPGQDGMPEVHLLRQAQAMPYVGVGTSFKLPTVRLHLAEVVWPLMTAPMCGKEDPLRSALRPLPESLNTPIHSLVLRVFCIPRLNLGICCNQ